jgi:predicted TIM-barrel fold metal-dependent hydrolase
VEAANLDLIILIDSYGIVQAGMIEKLLRVAFIPKTRWIFAHMGVTDFMKFAGIQLVNELNKGALDNVYFDISASINIYADSPLQDEYTWTMRSIGIDKILFGTDFPAFSLSQTLESFNKLDLTDVERTKILYENAKRLLEL